MARVGLPRQDIMGELDGVPLVLCRVLSIEDPAPSFHGQELVAGPVFVVSGTDDLVGPSVPLLIFGDLNDDPQVAVEPG